MTDIIKQRLIGSVLLLFVIGSAAYFLISNANNDNDVQKSIDLPTIEKTDFKSSIEPMAVEFIEDDQETLLDPHDLEKQNISDADKEEKTQTLLAPAPAPAPEPKVTTPTPEPSVIAKPANISKSEPSWLIQLGSFSVHSNAQALHDKVSKLGLEPKIEKISTQNKISYRVRIGPEHNKQRVDEIVAQLSTEFGIKPQVLLQQPEIKQ